MNIVDLVGWGFGYLGCQAWLLEYPNPQLTKSPTYGGYPFGNENSNFEPCPWTLNTRKIP